MWLWDPPFLCARCTGFYFAILLGMLAIIAVAKFRLSLRTGTILAALSLLAIALEKLLALDLGNGIRCLTALPLGFALGQGLLSPLASYLNPTPPP